MHHGINYLALAVFILFLFGMDYYVFQGVKTFSLGWKMIGARRVLLWGYWIISLTVLINLFYGLGRVGKHDITDSYVKFALNTFVIFAISKLAFVLIMFGEDVFRFLEYIYNKVYQRGSSASFMPERRKFISQAALILAGLNFSSLIYGAIKGKYRFTVHKTILYFENLPDGFDGFKLVQLSDIHIGSFDNREEVWKGLEMVLDEKPDLFVFTGDMVNNRADEFEPWMDYFKKIKAPYGQFSILGNHDYGDYVRWESEKAKEDNIEKLKTLQELAGLKMLNNSHVRLTKNGDEIVLAGVENWGKGFVQKGDLKKAMAGVGENDFTILLSHDPSHWDEEIKSYPKNIDLTLSGHTHGMQMGIETPFFKFSPVQFRYKNWAGLATEGDKFLYVNRGFGHIGYSGRTGIWPEIGVIELRKKIL